MRRRQYPRSTHGQSGFTLAEVLVASMLLLVAMAGFVPFFLSGLEKSAMARYESAATNVGRQVLEEIRQLDYRDIVEDATAPSDPANLSNRLPRTLEMRGSTFNVDYSVEPSTVGGQLLKRVIVTVSWDGNPAGQTVVSSLIHQQYLGPRISGVEFSAGSTAADPLGTPFPVLSVAPVARVQIATPDFELIFRDLNLPTMTPRPVYARVGFVDDAGAIVPVGNAADDYRIPNTTLRYSVDANGIVTAVWFEIPLDTTLIPDGYWEIHAVAYNEHGQQGNTWRIRVRIDHLPPDAPASVTALGRGDNQSISVSWVPGSERDRAAWVLERMKVWDGATLSGTWTTVTQLPGTASSYLDVGDLALHLDPWGDPVSGLYNYYAYRVHAVDLAGNHGPGSVVFERLPTLNTTTTTTPTSTSSTTSTTGPSTFSVIISNDTSKAYDVTIVDATSAIVFSGRVAKNGGLLTPAGLGAGVYRITAVEAQPVNPRTVTAGFSLPELAGQIVLQLLP